MTTTTTACETWGDWFGSFATAPAAKRYLTITWVGPKVADRDRWCGSEVREFNGVWRVRLCEAPFTSALRRSEVSA